MEREEEIGDFSSVDLYATETALKEEKETAFNRLTLGRTIGVMFAEMRPNGEIREEVLK
jgi:hypothetical protein